MGRSLNLFSPATKRGFLCTRIEYQFSQIQINMRTTIKIFALALLFSAGHFITLNAQPGGGNWNADPEQRATQQTAMMTEKLALSEAQSTKVKEINLKYANKMKEAREKSAGDREAMRNTVGTIRQEQDAELQTVLTEDQWKQWVTTREEMRGNRGNSDKPAGDKPAGKKDKSKKKDKQKKSDTPNEQ